MTIKRNSRGNQPSQVELEAWREALGKARDIATLTVLASNHLPSKQADALMELAIETLVSVKGAMKAIQPYIDRKENRR